MVHDNTIRLFIQTNPTDIRSFEATNISCIGCPFGINGRIFHTIKYFNVGLKNLETKTKAIKFDVFIEH